MDIKTKGRKTGPILKLKKNDMFVNKALGDLMV